MLEVFTFTPAPISVNKLDKAGSGPCAATMLSVPVMSATWKAIQSGEIWEGFAEKLQPTDAQIVEAAAVLKAVPEKKKKKRTAPSKAPPKEKKRARVVPPKVPSDAQVSAMVHGYLQNVLDTKRPPKGIEAEDGDTPATLYERNKDALEPVLGFSTYLATMYK